MVETETQVPGSIGHLTCRFCDDPAVAIFYLPQGCICHPEDRQQALCMQHVVKSNPIGDMALDEDLTEDNKFTDWWERRDIL